MKKNAVPVIYDIEQCYAQAAQKRFIAYYKKIYQSVACFILCSLAIERGMDKTAIAFED